MKCFRFAIPMLILLVAGVAKADSIPTFTITTAFAGAGPNEGIGDNAGLELLGPGGFDLQAFGGTSSYGFFTDTFSAGDSVGGFGMSWTDFSLTIGKTTYDHILIDLSSVFVEPHGDLTVPGGCAPATLTSTFGGPIQVSAGGGDNFITFNLLTPPGTLCVSFDPVEGNPSLYTFAGANFFAFSTVPEPGTLALMATGLAGVFGVVQKKRRCGQGYK
jgi:hypothetical protein